MVARLRGICQPFPVTKHAQVMRGQKRSKKPPAKKELLFVNKKKQKNFLDSGYGRENGTEANR
jgi:hypothetical protein